MTAPNIRVFLGTLEKRGPPQGGNLRAQGVTHPASCGVTRKCSYGYFCSISHFERHVQSLTAFDPLQPPFPTLQVWTPRLRRFLGMPRVTWPANGRAQAFGFCRFLVFFSVLCGSCSVQVHRPLKEKWPRSFPSSHPPGEPGGPVTIPTAPTCQVSACHQAVISVFFCPLPFCPYIHTDVRGNSVVLLM